MDLYNRMSQRGVKHPQDSMCKFNIQFLLYASIFQTTVLQFDWRHAFRDLSSSVAHCITIAVEDFSSKILQYEQNQQTSTTCYVMNCVKVQHMKEFWEGVREEEQPKQISKARIKKYEI